MNNSICLELKDVTIEYKIREQFSIKRNLIKADGKKGNTFVAVKNVTFSLEKGEVIGIIGDNGAGKSTLLRAIAGVYRADKGIIDLKGNRSALMALGVGFNPRLTGEENVILSGMLLGMSKKEMYNRMEAIVDFAGIADFMDKPIMTYSSGMYTKLAFAITVCIDTDIMLIDEVLSVGDAGFQKKSFAKMKELIKDNERSVLMVSHNPGTIKSFCERVIWLHKGEIIETGSTDKVMDHYQQYLEDKGNINKGKQGA